ncbi:hypothetical protein [Methanobrevibacter sp.]
MTTYSLNILTLLWSSCHELLLDTNIGLGYVFCTDPWNDKTEHLFNKEGTFYISYCVGKEFDKKYNNILKKQMNFLYSLRNDLAIQNSSKKLSLKNLKMKSLIIELKRDFDDNLKEEIVEVLWKRCKNKHKFDSQLYKNMYALLKTF